MRVLVTGAAGFIGMHCAARLLARGNEVLGLDNLSPYYSVELKQARLRQLEGRTGFRFERLDLCDADATEAAFATLGGSVTASPDHASESSRSRAR